MPNVAVQAGNVPAHPCPTWPAFIFPALLSPAWSKAALISPSPTWKAALRAPVSIPPLRCTHVFSRLSRPARTQRGTLSVFLRELARHRVSSKLGSRPSCQPGKRYLAARDKRRRRVDAATFAAFPVCVCKKKKEGHGELQRRPSRHSPRFCHLMC